MIALDTNVLVRLVTRDNEAQAQRAKAVFDAHGGARWLVRVRHRAGCRED